MRKYQEIWNRVKNKDKVSIHVFDSSQLARIKKAVVKEKWMDLSFKICNDFDGWKLYFSFDVSTRVLTIRLRQTFGLEDKVL